jgi:hypothetical protein
MKFCITCLSLFLIVSTAKAQNPRVETIGNRQIHTYNYWKGGDSIRLTIVGKNDTVQENGYYRNGVLVSMQWKKDSLKLFDQLGRLQTVFYGLGDDYYRSDSARSFYTNGQLRTLSIDTNGVNIRKDYDENGEINYNYTQKRTPLRVESRNTGKNGVPIMATRMDSVLINDEMVRFNFDTLFYPNGQPSKIEKRSSKSGLLGTNIYDEAGKLVHTVPADSLNLIIFKDNVDCYYGLKTIRGDTVVKPRFDRINQEENLFFAAYTGENAVLLDRKGALMPSPVSRLSLVTKMRALSSTSYSYRLKMDSKVKSLSDLLPSKRYFTFMEGENFGVMSEKGSLVMTPQYLTLQNGYLGDGMYFQFLEKQKDSLISMGFLDRQGKRILSPNKRVSHADFEDYFIFNTNIEHYAGIEYFIESQLSSGKIIDAAIDLSVFNHTGLGKGDGTVLLPAKFMEIKRLNDRDLFLCKLAKNENADKLGNLRYAIFEPRTQRWLLDTTHFRIDNDINNPCDYFVIQDLKTKKYGIMDTTGVYVLPILYDSVGVADNLRDKFWVKKGKGWHIFEMIDGKSTLHTAKFDYLRAVNFNYYFHTGYQNVIYFLARKNGKWGVIDMSDKVIKPFDYDYAALDPKNTERFVLAKNNTIAYFDKNSLPNETIVYKNKENEASEPLLASFELADNKERLFFVNDALKIVIPPQYKLLEAPKSNYFLVEDAQKKRKIIYAETGRIVDYPFFYEIMDASSSSNIIVVKDSLKNSYGVVSTDGKLLIPCNNYGIAVGEAESSTFFVRKDTVKLPKDYYDNFYNFIRQTKCDSLGFEDSDWLLYNGTGKLMNAQAFRYPIEFRNNIGVGMKTDGFNLYKTDGSIVMPFVKNVVNASQNGIYTEGSSDGFKSIHVDPKLGFYSLFKNQGMTPIGILTKPDGEILVESGRYDGISSFYGKYAVVTAAGKVGLIDSFGREVIAPQDLRVYPQQFMDSLNLSNVELLKKLDVIWTSNSALQPQPLVFEYNSAIFHPDSLKISKTLKAHLWNLLLEKCLPQMVHTASNVVFERSHKKLTTDDFCSIHNDFEERRQATPRRMVVNDTTIAFALQQKLQYEDEKVIFYNFYHRNNRWNELKINDLLNLQGDKRWLMNDLITKKVKALKDQQIDCSNAAAFITTVENRWQLTRKGIDFCFDSLQRSSEFVVISFTWAELQPFLKLKIY